jgi:hypothetical protein
MIPIQGRRRQRGDGTLPVGKINSTRLREAGMTNVQSPNQLATAVSDASGGWRKCKDMMRRKVNANQAAPAARIQPIGLLGRRVTRIAPIVARAIPVTT